FAKPIFDMDELFGRSSNEGENGCSRKATLRKKKNDGELVRLRSSTFEMKSKFDVVRQLQEGRNSLDEFLDPTTRVEKSKRIVVKNAKKKSTKETKSVTVKRKTKIRYRNRRGRCNSMVLTNVKFE